MVYKYVFVCVCVRTTIIVCVCAAIMSVPLHHSSSMTEDLSVLPASVPTVGFFLCVYVSFCFVFFMATDSQMTSTRSTFVPSSQKVSVLLLILVVEMITIIHCVFNIIIFIIIVCY